VGDAPPLFKTGDHVRLTFVTLIRPGPLTVEAEVMLASANGRSLTLCYYNIFRGSGQIPVLWEDGEFRNHATGQPVTIEAVS
jgi:hypothetical protein